MSRSWLLLVLLMLVGCGTEPTAVAPPAAAHFELSVQEALAWFEERTLECMGPEAPFPDARQWVCTHEFRDGSTLAVQITGDREGVSQLVGVAAGFDAEDSVSFLVTSVAVLSVRARAREELAVWAREHAEMGGWIVIGQAAIELRPHSARRAIVVNARAAP